MRRGGAWGGHRDAQEAEGARPELGVAPWRCRDREPRKDPAAPGRRRRLHTGANAALNPFHGRVYDELVDDGGLEGKPAMTENHDEPEGLERILDQLRELPPKVALELFGRLRRETLPPANDDSAELFHIFLDEDGTTDGLPDRFDSPTPGRDPTTVGPYRILEKIGGGGMGVVHRAEEIDTRKTVAIKLIRADFPAVGQILARFEVERNALARMDHPNVARVFGGGKARDGRPYFAMELVPGVPLTQFCDERRLSIRDRLELFTAVCEGVQHAHQKGVLHRDLKPSNILVSDLGGSAPVAKVIDFGLAKPLHGRLADASVHSVPGEFMGTHEYASPEQFASSQQGVDTRSDIYSLGAILYELLTGVIPLEGIRESGSLEALRILHEVDPPRPSRRVLAGTRDPSSVSRRRPIHARAESDDAEGEDRDGEEAARARRQSDPEALSRAIQGDLDAITMKALEKDRQRRYPDVSSLVADIGKHLSNEPIDARTHGFVYVAQKFVRRNRRAVGIVSLILILLACIPLAYGVSRGRERRDRLANATERLTTGRQNFEDYIRLRDTIGEKKTAWEAASTQIKTWYPEWKRRPANAAHDEHLRAVSESAKRFETAILDSFNAGVTAPEGSAVRDLALAEYQRAHWLRYLEASKTGGVTIEPEFFLETVLAIDRGDYRDRVEGDRSVTIHTGSAGAAIHCFRYEVREDRLVPIPLNVHATNDSLADRLIEKPRLTIESVHRADEHFEAGDVLLEVASRDVSTREELAKAIEAAGPTTSMTFRLERDGAPRIRRVDSAPERRVRAGGSLRGNRAIADRDS